MGTVGKPLLQALRGEAMSPPPIWLMRQAGRYLPEYQSIRATAGSFLDLCLTPDLAVEVTLQPIRRFGFDGAILFSDILVVPYGLGQAVSFEEGVGPRLPALRGRKDVAALSQARMRETLAPVYETVTRLRASLPEETALIGFAGAPWTVASYMIEGGKSADFAAAKAWAYTAPDEFRELIEILVDATSAHLIAQAAAGADALQIFDSWAGIWPDNELRKWCIAPTTEIVRRVKEAYPEIPVVLFPRGVGACQQAFARECGADGMSLDTTTPLDWARANLQPHVTIQGNLDPLLLMAGGVAMRERTEEILGTFAEGPFVFNLGHGVVPGTPPGHVAALVEIVRAWRPKVHGP